MFRIQQCQIQFVGRVWDNFKSNTITTDVAALVWGAALSCSSISIFPNQHDWFNISTSVRYPSKSWVDFYTYDHILLASDVSVVPENGEHVFSSRRLSLEFFLSWRNGMMIIQVTGFSFPGCSDALNSYHLWQCCTENRYSRFQSFCLHLRCKLMQHSSEKQIL